MSSTGGSCACIKSDGFRRFIGFLGISCAAAIGTIAVFNIKDDPSFHDVVFGIYQIIFGLLLILAEFKIRNLLHWFYFMTPYIGLGLFYIFVALYAITEKKWYVYLVVGCTGAVGVINMIYGFSGFKRVESSNEIASNQKAQQIKEDVRAKEQYAVQQSKAAANNAAASASAHLEEGTYNQSNPFESQSNYSSAYN